MGREAGDRDSGETEGGGEKVWGECGGDRVGERIGDGWRVR